MFSISVDVFSNEILKYAFCIYVGVLAFEWDQVFDSFYYAAVGFDFGSFRRYIVREFWSFT